FNWNDSNLIKKMNNSLKHRGPDGFGIYTDNLVSLGHRRLAIIDLTKRGKQPMEYEHKGRKAVITYNGEVYSFLELREKLEKRGYKFKSNTDTEVILASYLEWGFDCVKKFNGMWAFCIYDPQKKILFCSRDRMGQKPFYYYYDGERFIFASEIKAILNHEVEREVNWQVFNKFISLRYCFGRETIFKNINRLLKSENLIFDLKTKKLFIKKYWDISFPISYITSEKLASEQLIKLLKDSIEKRLIADVPLGVFLSGGLDSSTIVAIMRTLDKNKEIKTYSVDFEYSIHNESKWAKIVSDKFNTTHTSFTISPNSYKILDKILWHLDEPMADPALIPLYYLSKNARRSVTVVLTGDGGDEIFAGYDQYRISLLTEKLSKTKIPIPVIKKIISLTPAKILNKIQKHAEIIGKKAISERICETVNFFRKEDYFSAYLNLISIFDNKERKKLLKKKYLPIENYNYLFKKPKNILNKFLYFDQNVLLPESFLMKTDKMTMANSLEARAPLLDHNIVKFSFFISPNLKLHSGITKYIPRKSVKLYLPKEILERKKQTFHVPIEEWIDKDLGKKFLKTMENSKSYFNSYYIEKLFKNYKKGKLYYARQIWNIICWIKWEEIYL
ncbi:asparagine synthase (glutamine-hydrolyzing), partial [bacterium]|nr:asparagine synthase (glutamine-hydrolyzing) [bacterium]